jgi:hypothetical protein
MSTSQTTTPNRKAPGRFCMCGDYKPCPHRTCLNCEVCEPCLPSAAITKTPAPAEIITPTDEERARLALFARCQTLAQTPLVTIITSNDEYEAVGERLKLLNAAEKEVTDPKGCISLWRDQLHQAHKTATTMIASAIDPLKVIKQRCSVLMWNWEQEAEKQRLARQEMINKSLATSVTATSVREAEDNQLEAAGVAHAAGDHARAEEILNQPVQPTVQFTPAIVVPSSLPRIAGISRRGDWKMEVTDLMELCKAVVAGTQPISFIEANESALNKQADATREHTNVPGCKAVFTPSINASGRK